MKVIVFVLISTLLLCYFAVEAKSSSKCSAKQYRRADHAVAKLISFGKYGRKFPENADNLKPFCE